MDQLKIFGTKPREVSKKRKERPIELTVDENGFLKQIQYGEESDEEDGFGSKVIYSAKGKKLDPFSYIKSLTPSNFSSKKVMADEENAQKQIVKSQSTNASSSSTATPSSTFNYYLSGIYSYSVGPLVNMFYTTPEKKESTPSYLDHSSLEILIKDDRCKY